MPTTRATLEQDVVRLLRARRAGEPRAESELFELLYEELRVQARMRLARERADHTLAPTALVHEVFVRLEGADLECVDRADFLALSASVMRRLLIDSARRRLASPIARSVEDAALAAAEGSASRAAALAERRRDGELSRLDGALEALEKRDPDLHRVVELRFLLGFDVPSTARELGVSTATVKRAWRTARAFLENELQRHDDD